MPDAFLTIRHPKDGELEFSRLGGQIRIHARWPFDLSTDEWIWLSVEVPASGFSRALKDSVRLREVRTASGPNGDSVTFSARGSVVEVDLIDGKIQPPKRLILSLDERQTSDLNTAIPAVEEQ